MLLKDNLRSAIAMGALIMTYLVGLTGYIYWWGGWSPGPRYLIPIVPLLVFLSIFFFNRLWHQKEWRVFFKLLFGMMAVAALLYWQAPKTLWNWEDGNIHFLIYWLGDKGKWIQSIFPSFFLPPPAPQAIASFYAALFVAINLLGVRDHQKKQ